MKFTADITFTTRKPLTEDALSAVAAIGGAASGKIGGKRVTTFITVSAPDMPAAAAEAIAQVTGVAPGRVDSVEVMTTEEHDRRLEEARPKLGGIAEVAELLGVTKQRAYQLAKRQDAPEPIANLASGPVWIMADWSTFSDGWSRKPGRPRKDLNGPANGAQYQGQQAAM